MKPHLIILGAGSAREAGRPLGLQKVTLEGRVLDWQLDAFSQLAPEVSFVGGYDIGAVMQGFPRLSYHFNAQWQETGAAASLALALEALNDLARGRRDLYIAYSDILLRPALVRALASTAAGGCAIAYDQFRPADGMRLPETLELDGSVREFIGLVRVPAPQVPVFRHAVLDRAPAFKRAHLSRLFAEIAGATGPLRATGVAAGGLWAHAEHGRSVARFVLGSKAATLERLQNRLARSRILPLAYFTRQAWLDNRDRVISDLLERFKGEHRLIVRSSATDEDGFERANAGCYHSELDVAPRADAIAAAVERVFSSYAGQDMLDEVLVQSQLESVKASGVMFTRTLETGAPYRVINYSEGSDTTAITAGASGDNVKFYVSRMAQSSALERLPPLVGRLLSAAEEIEACVCHDALDIEFALDAEDRLITLQVRPLMVSDANLDRERDSEVSDCQAGMRAALRELSPPSPGHVGDAAIWSVMADWNPAEIVGLTPGPLALDLYRHIITDRVWAQQRFEAGYRDLRGWPLVRSFGGQAFVDVRASASSFVPASLPDDLARRMVNHALATLRADRSLHDKLEFELVPTCLDFGFERWAGRYLAAGVCGEGEVARLRDALRGVTRNILGRADGALAGARALEARCPPIERVTAPFGDWLRRTLAVCSGEGALGFAHLARAGFVAAALLRSAVQSGLIADNRRAALMESIPGTGHMLAEAALAVREGRMARDDLVARFGHLRPGTYDIATPAYRDRPEVYLDPIIAAAREYPVQPFEWHREERAALDAALAMLDIGLDARGLLAFTRATVAGREYSKFVFTRLLSCALDALAEHGRAAGVAEDHLDCMPLDAWLAQPILAWGQAAARAELVQQTVARHRQRRLASRIMLPPVLAHPDEAHAFIVPPSEPTFITGRRARGTLRIIGAGQTVSREAVAGCVVAIANADPGFDYLFALGILGLVTAYGGPNSHMAIRASEFAIPAVIGIGERAFSRLRDGASAELDGQRRLWRQEGIS